MKGAEREVLARQYARELVGEVRVGTGAYEWQDVADEAAIVLMAPILERLIEEVEKAR